MTLEVVLHSSWPLVSPEGDEPSKKKLSQTVTMLTGAKLKSKEEIEAEDEETIMEFSFQ